MYLYGVLCVVFACTLSSFGVNLQKKSHSISNIYVQCVVFLSGVACTICSACFDFIALYFMSQLQLGIVGSLGLILNAVISQKGFREKMNKKQRIGLILIVVGILCGVYGTYTTHHKASLSAWNTSQARAVICINIVILHALYISTVWSESFVPVGAMTGLFASMMVFFAKYVTTASSSHLEYNEQIFTAILLVLFSGGAHLYFYNVALTRGKASTVVPVHQLFWLLGCLFYGTFALSQSIPNTTYAILSTIVGMLLCGSGIAIYFSDKSETRKIQYAHIATVNNLPLQTAIGT